MAGMSKKIPFNSELHRMLLRRMKEYKDFSSGKMRDTHLRWQQTDEAMRGYVKLSDVDQLRKSRKETDGKVDYVTLEIPYAFATVSAIHTYITSVFLGRNPIYQFSARHGEGQNGVLAVEAVMDYQRQVGRHLPYLYNWMWDGAKYGMAVIGEYWEKETRRVSSIERRKKTFLGIPTGGMETVRTVREITGFEGNRLYTIRGYDWFPDPRVPVYDFQRGEFCGRQVQVGLSTILELAESMEYTNVEILAQTRGDPDRLMHYSPPEPTTGADVGLEPGSPQSEPPYGVGGVGTTDSLPVGKNFITLLEMVVKISPRAWGLGDTDRVEKWIFTVANDAIVIGARPLGCLHDRFPYSVIETGFGSEDFIKLSLVDQIKPLTDALTWLFNTHMYNVRKAINDVRVVDPSRVVMKDFEQPQPGGIIRLKDFAFGTDVRTAITQLPTMDITQNHLRDIQVIEQLIQRTSGAVDAVMGMHKSGSRVTATESRSATGFSVQRLKTIAEYWSALGVSELIERMLSNTQQYMTEERMYAVAGNLMNNAGNVLQVSPEAIAGGFDFVPVDGTLPVDRLAQANFWKELMVQMSRVPQFAQQFDLGEMVAYTMALQGERNVERFRIKLQDPAMLQQQAQAGNVVPISEAMNGLPRGAGSSGGTY